MSYRKIKNVWDVIPREGSGTHLRVGHVLPPGNWEEFDPFLIMAEDWFQSGTFGFHPHRGIQTITYVIDGKLKHEDNHGGYGVLATGDVQLMTAGRGIIHSEDPLPGETVHSLQLWLNLPSTQKLVEPSYQDLLSRHMPLYKEEGVSIRVFSGTAGDVKADTKNITPLTYLEMTIEAGTTYTQRIPSSYNGFIYILKGNGHFGKNQTRGEANQVLWLGTEVGNDAESLIEIKASEDLLALFIAGEPINEPVVARGPFVMNTEEEIKQAYEDYYAGKFGKVR